MGLEDPLGEARFWTNALPAQEGEQGEGCGVESRANWAGQQQTGRARQTEPGEQKALGLYKWILLKRKFPPIPEMEPRSSMTSSGASSGEGAAATGTQAGTETPSQPISPRHPPSSSPPLMTGVTGFLGDLKHPHTF